MSGPGITSIATLASTDVRSAILTVQTVWLFRYFRASRRIIPAVRRLDLLFSVSRRTTIDMEIPNPSKLTEPHATCQSVIARPLLYRFQTEEKQRRLRAQYHQWQVYGYSHAVAVETLLIRVHLLFTWVLL